MNANLFIARRIYFKMQQDGKKSFHPAVSIAVGGIALGIVVMLLSIFIVIGFKEEIQERVIGFGSHLQISSYTGNYSYESSSMSFSEELKRDMLSIENVASLSPFATKASIVKTDSMVIPMILKGVGKGFNYSFFVKSLVAGEIPSFDSIKSKEDVLISESLASRLGMGVGDRMLCYFFQNHIKARKLTIKGIYNTGFAENDELIAIGSLSLLQKVNNWKEDKVGGVEILLKDFYLLDSTLDEVKLALLSYRDTQNIPLYHARSIKDIFPSIFSWLSVLDTNVWIILILMTLISGFTMISGLLIIILERVSEIGTLKALGTPNRSIRKIFLYVSGFLICRGMFWGNLIGLGLYFFQHYTHLMKLNPAIYYVPYVPMKFSLLGFILLNIGVFFVVMWMLVGPSHIIARIRPAKTIRFD